MGCNSLLGKELDTSSKSDIYSYLLDDYQQYFQDLGENYGYRKKYNYQQNILSIIISLTT
jgi:hypothetical protein